MGIFRRKTEYDFYDGFLRLAEGAAQAAVCFHESLQTGRVRKLQQHLQQLQTLENTVKARKQTIIGQLTYAFITPIEREDIVALAQTLVAVTGAIVAAARRVDAYALTQLRPETVLCTDLLVQTCKELVSAVAELRNFSKSQSLGRQIAELRALVSRGELLLTQTLRQLFAEAGSSRTLLVWSSLFEQLGSCLAACNNAADLLEQISLKNA